MAITSKSILFYDFTKKLNDKTIIVNIQDDSDDTSVI